MERYGKYKDSGVEWIGEIPEGWEVKRSRYLFEVRKRIVGELGFDILSITQKGIKVKDIKSNDGQMASDYSKYQLVKKGDFAMNHMDLLTGFIDIANQEGATSPDYRVFSSIDNESDSKFYLFLFQMMYTRKIFYAFGRGAALFGRWRLPADEFKSFLFPYPLKHDQTTIANYLVLKTAEIDQLIAQKERLLCLYEEEKTAIINQAVTRGINPDVKLKDSGIDWLGEIPEGWEVEKLRYVTSYFKGNAFKSSDFHKDGIPVIKATNIKNKTIVNITSFIGFENQRNEFERVRLKEGDIIISTVGSKPEIIASAVGQLASINAEFSDSYLNQNTLCIRPVFFITASFLKHAFFSKYTRSKFDASSLWIANQAYLEVESIRNIELPIPTPKEQTTIVHHIETQTTRINARITKTKKIIALQKEYRTALISEVVTGKIKVTQEMVS